jgi:hypothetical protein
LRRLSELAQEIKRSRRSSCSRRLELFGRLEPLFLRDFR